MQRLVVVSNRLPVSIESTSDIDVTAKPSAGGLVTAMRPVLERAGGIWVGWPGVEADEQALRVALQSCTDGQPYGLEPVILPQGLIEDYYGGFANSVLWPLFHGFPDRCDFQPRYWDAYVEANRQFADATDAQLSTDEAAWVHDYHLVLLGEELRKRGRSETLGFFLHIPFPQLGNFLKLPWRAELLTAFLAYDVVGFQTQRDRRNFLDCVERLVPGVSVERAHGEATIEVGGRSVRVGIFPIGIDTRSWSEIAAEPSVAARAETLAKELRGRKVLLGVDRLDYSKGLVERLRAFECLLETHPELREQVVLLQLVVPSREGVPEYQAIKSEIEGLVGRISGRFATPRWSPIHYLYNRVSPAELCSLYRLAQVAVVTPLCDGMNLVAKEFCCARLDEGGVLVLSENAGAAAELADSALLVNPYDVVETAEAYYTALTMPPSQIAQRMRALRKQVLDGDVFKWAESFIDALSDAPGARVSPPSHSEYLPTIELGRALH